MGVALIICVSSYYGSSLVSILCAKYRVKLKWESINLNDS